MGHAIRSAAAIAGICSLVACGSSAPIPPAKDTTSELLDRSPASDPQALEIAEAVLKRMGGREAWEATRGVRWRFFGGRLHYWDRSTGQIRIESPAREDRPARVVLMNIDTKQGRVWDDGQEVTGPAALEEALELAHQWWVNDSYWMFMPYKLLDPGVTLEYVDKRPLDDGRAADVLALTFGENVGYTPRNRYEVYVARDTGLIEQWSFWADASDAEPRFTLPWQDWKPFGKIWLATGHGRGLDWEIAVFDELPRSIFEDPSPIEG